VASDTIYKLAVDSTAYPEQATVLLLDDGVLRMEADGRGTRTYRQVVQVLRSRAVTNLQEREFSYDPDRQRLIVNWIQVLRTNGEMVSAKPAQTQESDVPAELENPVYVHRRVIHSSLTGVGPGTLVDVSYTVEERNPYRPGDFVDSWSITTGTTVKRSRYLVDVPRNLDVRVVERNLNFKRRETVVGDRKVYVWATKDVPWTRPEPYSPPADSNPLIMQVSLSAPGSWSDVGRWYAKLAHDRMQPDSSLRDTVRGIVIHATSLQDSISAIQRWVAQDIRYVSVSLGIGGYQPRAPATVLSTGFGDCKDKATLFIVALKVIGVDAYPVLLNAGGRPDRALPTIGAFDHMIAAIRRPSGYEFVDLTSEYSPLGTLPYPDAGEFGLLVHPDGSSEQVTTPSDPANINLNDTRIVGVLAPDGTISGRVTWSGSGSPALYMRAAMATRMDSTQRESFLRKAASSWFPNAKGDSLATFDGKDLRAKPVVTYQFRDGQATQRSGNTDILLWRDESARWSRAADEFAARLPRRMPIDAAQVVGPQSFVTEARITLPAGWHARLPESVTATSAFGRYESVYQQNGQELLISRHLSGTTGILPKESAPELLAWLRALAKDRVAFVILDHDAVAQ
jgi:transglutaminase-like putative cysteine protease